MRRLRSGDPPPGPELRPRSRAEPGSGVGLSRAPENEPAIRPTTPKLEPPIREPARPPSAAPQAELGPGNLSIPSPVGTPMSEPSPRPGPG